MEVLGLMTQDMRCHVGPSLVHVSNQTLNVHNGPSCFVSSSMVSGLCGMGAAWGICRSQASLQSATTWIIESLSLSLSPSLSLRISLHMT